MSHNLECYEYHVTIHEYKKYILIVTKIKKKKNLLIFMKLKILIKIADFLNI